MDVVVRIAERKVGASLALNLLALAGSLRHRHTDKAANYQDYYPPPQYDVP